VGDTVAKNLICTYACSDAEDDVNSEYHKCVLCQFNYYYNDKNQPSNAINKKK